MLRDLHIRNLAVLSEASIELGSGFNVLSGETGAGKSIVVDSLALLSGARASSELIRTGAETMSVSGVFAPGGARWRRLLDEAGLQAEGEELVIRREVSRGGRNRVFVNDQPVTLRLLSQLAPELLRIHGQREELGLVAPDLQRSWLDRMGGAKGAQQLQRTAEAWRTWKGLADRLQAVRGDDRARRERIDFLRFQLEEIDGVAPVQGEELELRAQRDLLRHAESIQQGLATACAQLFEEEGSASDTLGRSRLALEGIAQWEPLAEAWATELREIGIRVDELQVALARRLSEVNSDPGRLDEIEDRLMQLERLFRKHGDSSEQLIARRQQLAEELAELAGDEESQDELEAELARALAEYEGRARELSTQRARWAQELERRVRAELRELALPQARYKVSLERRKRSDSPLFVDGQPTEFGELGYDQVLYLFSPNPGEELRPLARVASGGELSRLYLAVQLSTRPSSGRKAASRGVASPTLVFDEVDSGVGGAEAAALGRKLHRLAQGGQVLAVTHLPQVASSGDLHYKVSKEVKRGRTHTQVQHLRGEERIAEVARMLTGSELTDLSLEHARELVGAVA